MEQGKNSYLVPFAIIIAGILIAGGVYFSNSNVPKEVADAGDMEDQDPLVPQDQQGEREISIRPIDENDHILGNPDAKVVIVEFSDLECPFCKAYHETLNRVIDVYGKEGEVVWVYRHFPLDALHSKARKEAEATECAAEQGGNSAFWDYTNRLYEITPSNNGLDLALLPQIAEDVGLDVEVFNNCLSEGRTADLVQEDYNEARGTGGTGTPHTIIIALDQKIPLQGAMPFESLKEILDQLLGE